MYRKRTLKTNQRNTPITAQTAPAVLLAGGSAVVWNAVK